MMICQILAVGQAPERGGCQTTGVNKEMEPSLSGVFGLLDEEDQELWQSHLVTVMTGKVGHWRGDQRDIWPTIKVTEGQSEDVN